MALTVTHKRGDTFLYTGVLRETKTGPAIDLTGWTIASMIRGLDGALVAALTVTISAPATGTYTLTADDTAEWPVGTASWDIQYTDDGGIIRSTETIQLRIIEDVTYPDPVVAP